MFTTSNKHSASKGMLCVWLLSALMETACMGESPRVLDPLASPNTAPRRVAVIGCGIGGGSFSYYFNENFSEADIVAFEARDYIGGRLKHTLLHDVLIELGGDAWSKSANPYVVELAKKIPPKNPPIAKRGIFANNLKKLHDPLRGAIAVWDGKNITDVEGFLAHLLSSDFRLGEIEADFLYALHENYKIRGDMGTFSTIEEFAADGDLAKYTSTFANATLTGLKPEMMEYFLNPMTRVIYHQDISKMHGFGALVSITSLLGADSYADGNSALVENLFTASGAIVRLETAVTRVAAKTSGSGYAVTYTADGGTTETTEDFDAVIVAAPIEYTNIEFGADIHVPAPRPFVYAYHPHTASTTWGPTYQDPAFLLHIFVTVVRAIRVNPETFNQRRSVKVSFDDVLTTPTANTPFIDVQQIATLTDGTTLFKMFSNDDITADLDSIFIGRSRDPADLVVQHWNYTFPHLTPRGQGGTRFQPVVLTDSQTVLYLNTLESAASAMETSIIAGRNAALKLSQLWH